MLFFFFLFFFITAVSVRIYLVYTLPCKKFFGKIFSLYIFSIYFYSSSLRSSGKKQVDLACLINIHEPLF